MYRTLSPKRPNFRISLFCLAVISLMCGNTFAQAKKYALLVGVEKYNPAQLTRLRYPEDDVIAIGAELEKAGFSVIVMTDQTEIPEREPNTATDILNQLDRRLRGRSSQDTVLVVLSGHGVQLKQDAVDPATGQKESYFCPKRANLTDRSSLVAMSVVMEKMAACQAGRKLLLVDACRNEVESSEIGTRSNSPVEIELDPAGIVRRTIPQGMLALFSCSSKERAFEVSDLGHSVFASKVLTYLRGEADVKRYPNQQLSVTEMAAFVSRETQDFIEEQLGEKQTPELIFPGGRLQDWSLGNHSPPVGYRAVEALLGVKFVQIRGGRLTKWQGEEYEETHEISDLMVMRHTVTTEQFARFVEATGYKTIRELAKRSDLVSLKRLGYFRPESAHIELRNINDGEIWREGKKNAAVGGLAGPDIIAFATWVSQSCRTSVRLPNGWEITWFRRDVLPSSTDGKTLGHLEPLVTTHELHEAQLSPGNFCIDRGDAIGTCWDALAPLPSTGFRLIVD